MTTCPPITLRLVKGSPLTIQEEDDNKAAFRDAIDAIFARIEATINADGTLKEPPVYYAASVEGVDDYEITLAPAPAAYADLIGKPIYLHADVANADADATLNVYGSAGVLLGAKAITKNGTAALEAGDIPLSGIVQLVYDGTRFQKV